MFHWGTIQRIQDALFSLLRQQAGLTVKHAGELLDLSVETIAEYERGTSVPTAREIQVLARHMRVRMGFALGHAVESAKSEITESAGPTGPDPGIEMQQPITETTAIKLTPPQLNGNGAVLGPRAMQPDVEVLQPQDVCAAFEWLRTQKLRPTVTMLDPWYNKGVGGVLPDTEYDSFIDMLIERACAISRHVYLWGFPEILGPFVRRIPSSHRTRRVAHMVL